MRRVKVHKGDFFDVPSGTVHAIGSGIMILETQQSSDTTYRLYDYDRVDDSGKKRDLHIEKSIDVSVIPHKDSIHTKRNFEQEKDTLITLVDNSYFKVQRLLSESSVTVNKKGKYFIATVIDGSGELEIRNKSYDIKKGDSFIVSKVIDVFEIKGKAELILSQKAGL